MKTLGHNPSMGVAYSSLWAPDWNDFYSPTYKTNWFSWEGFALDLPLKARVSEIWKWLTLSSVNYTMTCQKIQPTVDIRYTNFKNGRKSKTYYPMIGGPELHLIKLATNSDQVLSGLLQEI